MNGKVNKSMYLGDSVYASFDGHYVWLGLDDHTNQVIALEPEVYAALVLFVENVVPLLKQKMRNDQ